MTAALRLTEAEAAELGRAGRLRDSTGRRIGNAPERASVIPGDARGAGPNKTELRFQRDHLEHGAWRWWAFEAVTLKLARHTHYRPDFIAVSTAGEVSIFEVKGAFIRDKAMVKPKVAARMFPAFKFYLAQWRGGQWSVTQIAQ